MLSSWGEQLTSSLQPPASTSDSAPAGAAQAGPADTAAREQACGLFDQARQMYLVAIAQEEDALTYGNLGDVLIQQAEVGGGLVV